MEIIVLSLLRSHVSAKHLPTHAKAADSEWAFELDDDDARGEPTTAAAFGFKEPIYGLKKIEFLNFSR